MILIFLYEDLTCLGSEVKTEERWREVYKEMEIEVKFNAKIKRTGMDWK